jgi:DNA-binding transcriptional MerR regulator
LDKAPDAFRTISEVADDLDVPQHVLRFWESRFPQIKPMKRAGGRRYYRPEDVRLLQGIRHLLYVEGYTIKGVRGILSDPEKGVKHVQTVWRQNSDKPDQHEVENAEPLPPDEAARTLFGLLKAPAAPEHDDDDVAEPPGTHAAAPVTAGLTRDQVRRLQSALHEMQECRRLIDGAMGDEAA